MQMPVRCKEDKTEPRMEMEEEKRQRKRRTAAAAAESSDRYRRSGLAWTNQTDYNNKRHKGKRAYRHDPLRKQATVHPRRATLRPSLETRLPLARGV